MRFGILGPLQVFGDDGTALRIRASKQRSLLAVLLVQAGEVVSADRLIDLVWNGRPPANPERVLHVHVSQLRRALHPHAPGRCRGDVLSRQPPGYRLSVEPGGLDVHRFERLVDEANESQADGDFEAAANHWREALSVWRGPALADVDVDDLRQTVAVRWDEARLAALEARIEADLLCGRHSQLVGELQLLVNEYPLRERLCCQLMLALYRAGRQAEALAVFTRVRRRLVDELGIEPAAELRGVHEAILTEQVSPDPPPRLPMVSAANAPQAGPRGGSGQPTPAQLPLDVGPFIGRQTELRRLDELAGKPTGAGAVIAALTGTAGVGKTALAVRWAHRVAGGFPDGQLYVDLRGYGPDRPLAPADALAAFLRALGEAEREIPDDVSERSARLRTTLTGRRVLIVLDNAASVEQVRPLLPGSASCVVVVTSRDALAGLVAREGAVRIRLDLMPTTDAVALLRALVGPRVAAEPAAAVSFVEACAHLPLALRVAAERAVAQPGTALAGLTAELADERFRLDLLEAGGDPHSALRAVFSWSYRHLPATAAAGFRRLGLHPGRHFDVYALAALADLDIATARRVIDALTGAHLVTAGGRGRYAMHDLLRAYVREVVQAEEPEADRRAALTRLFDHYRYGTARAMDLLYPAERTRRPEVAPRLPAPDLDDRAAAAVWLDDDRANLVAVVDHAADAGWPRHATEIAAIMFRYLQMGCHNDDALAVHHGALRASRSCGDRTGEANALTNIGIVHGIRGRLDTAIEWYERALATFNDVGDLVGQARTLHNLAVVHQRRDNSDRAAPYLRRALRLFRQAGDRVGEAASLGGIGLIHLRRKQYDEALDCRRQALDIARETGDRHGEAQHLNHLGMIHADRGDASAAARYFHRALAVAEDVADRARTGEVLYHLGMVHARQGEWGEAAAHHERALGLARETGEAYGQMLALNGLGEALQALGRIGEAMACFTEALDLATAAGSRVERTRAHDGLHGPRSGPRA